jgi:hypothetical protein
MRAGSKVSQTTLPALCGRHGGHGERQRLPPTVDVHQEVVVEQRSAVFTAVGVSGAIAEERDAAGQPIRPIPFGHSSSLSTVAQPTDLVLARIARDTLPPTQLGQIAEAFQPVQASSTEIPSWICHP